MDEGRSAVTAQLERALRLANGTTDALTRERLLRAADELTQILNAMTDPRRVKSRYYFDVRDGDQFIADEEGSDVADLEAVRRKAVRLLIDQSRKVDDQRLGSMAASGVSVRDAAGRLVMRVTVQVEVLRKN